ncbi:tripartite tricarboxylate transporter TctB family protein [Actinoalloteichus hymeniacidonis]|uniref:Tripartite tricarboxylate transporter TctB family n=1 Tax=Actinoalloteichus hymeniacidonis TaxID=340345 RepID=A0AAC9MZK1_9PSEU|nr:tripartite tricarboxylate transporter TctB family protein [Actinoalloteichus hymeniacidonis]AOS64036.1 Tripartite tricarboxylate transporter TctB family [Actinoalloteichus hymeniacidonis]MBB5907902.1 hypothetical protein [Actinoalloteichus hymeniacidonis]
MTSADDAERESAATPAAGSKDSAPGTADTTAAEPSLAEALVAVEEAEHEDRPAPTGTLGNVVTAAAVLVLGVAMLLGSWSLGIGTASAPDSGTWPLLVSVVLVVLAVALLASARKASGGEQFSTRALLVLAGLGTMVAFVAVIELVGFEIPAAVLTFVWLRFLGRESWRTSIITSIAVTAAFYALFVGAFSVPIPHLF